MDLEIIGTIIITAITVLGSAEAFKYYKSKLTLKSKSMDLREEHKKDLQKRVNRLEVLLTESSEEKDKLRIDVLKLTEEVATLRERVKFLEAENERLKIINK
jgi:predicted nuclease with TOPRIM domain